MQNAFWERSALPNYKPCPNCGEKFHPVSLGPHVKRCRRLRPKGRANGAGGPAGAFEGMWGVDTKPLPAPPSALELLGASLKSLVTGDDKETPEDEAASPFDEEERERLRALFSKFDENGDGRLSQREHGMLLFNCFPDRMLDAKALLDEFKTVDADGSGTVDFDEFCRYYGEMVLPAATSDFEEAADMFAFFDADHSGELDKHEFLSLLNNIFPDHCDDNENAVATEFAEADSDGNDAISFTEFCAYYDRLRSLYGDTKPLTPEELAAAAKAASKPPPKSAATPAAASAKPAKEAARATKAAKAGRGKQGASSPPAQAPTAMPAAADPVLMQRLAQVDELLANGLISQAECDAKRSEILGSASSGPSSQFSSHAAPPVAPTPAEVVTCSGCGEAFLPHLLPKHQRACGKVKPVKKRVQFSERPKSNDERPLPKAGAAEQALASIEFADNGSNSFVGCDKCGRTFFPDRLPIHQRACKGRKAEPQELGEMEA